MQLGSKEFLIIAAQLGLTSLMGHQGYDRLERGEYEPSTAELKYRKGRKKRNKLAKLSRRRNR